MLELDEQVDEAFWFIRLGLPLRILQKRSNWFYGYYQGNEYVY